MATAPDSDSDSDYSDAAELAVLLVSRPQDVIERLYRLRDEFYNGEEGCQDSHSEYLDLVSDLSHAFLPSKRTDSYNLLPAVDAGLVEFLVDTIANDRFFMEPKNVQDFHIWALAVLVIGSGKESLFAAGERALRSAPSLFKSIWDHWRLVRLSGPAKFVHPKTGYSTEPLAELIGGYLELYRILTTDNTAPSDCYIHHIHVLLWLLSHEEKGVPPVHVSYQLSTSFFHRPPSWSTDWIKKSYRIEDVSFRTSAHDEPLVDVFVQQCLINGIGVNRFLECYEKQLRRIATGQLATLEYEDVVACFHMLFYSKHLTSALARRNTLACGIAAMKALLPAAKVGEGGAVTAWNWCIRVYDQVDTHLRGQVLAGAYASVLSMPSLRSDVVDIFASGVRLAASSRGSEPIMSAEALAHLNQVLGEWISEREDASRTGPNAPPFDNLNLVKGGRPLWWPALRELQTVCQAQRVSDDLSRLLSLWADFGRVLGLDAKKERIRHERDARAYCSWIDCTYHAERVPATLLTCKGCGDARYCGRDCQKLDWKRGGHKHACRRLK